MKKSIQFPFILILGLSFCQRLISQDDNLIWKNSFSQSEMCSRDVPVDFVLSHDSLLYVTGFTERNFSNFDVVTFAYDQSGSLLWEKVYSTYEKDFSYDKPVKIVTDKSGNVYVLGKRQINYRTEAFFALKYNNDGDLLWSYVTSPEVVNDQLTALSAMDIIADNDENIYLIGRYANVVQENNSFIIKFDREGNEKWTKNYPYASPMFARFDGEQHFYVMANTNLNNEYLISKIDTAGSVIWERLFDYGEGDIKEITDMQYYDNCIYALMNVWPSIDHFNNRQDICLYRLSQDGTILYESSYDGQNYDQATSLHIVNDSLLIVGLNSMNFQNDLDAKLLKYNKTGELLDSCIFSANTGKDDMLVDMVTDRYLNTYVIVNSMLNEIVCQAFYVKIDSGFNLKWIRPHLYEADALFYPDELFLTSGNTLALAGSLNSTINPGLSYPTHIDFSLNWIDTSGVKIKTENYTGEGTSNFRRSEMEFDSTANLYISGYSQIGPDWEYFDIYEIYNYHVLKYDRNGNLNWAQSIDSDTLQEWTFLGQFIFGDFVTIAGNYYLEDTDKRYTILYKYDSAGNLINSKCINNFGYYCVKAEMDKAGNIYLYTPRYNNTYSSLIKLDDELHFQWEYQLEEFNQQEENVAIRILPDGKVYFAGKDHKLTILNPNGTLSESIDLSACFTAFSDLFVDGDLNIYIAGITKTDNYKASFVKVDPAGQVSWKVTDDRMVSVNKLIRQENSNTFVLVGKNVGSYHASQTVFIKIDENGTIDGFQTIDNLFSQEVVTDKNDFIYVANEKNYFVVLSPDLDSLYRNYSLKDSIFYSYYLSDIVTESDFVYITGAYGNELYLHSNEWNSLTTVKFRKYNTRPLIRELDEYYRMLPGDTAILSFSIVDFENDPCTVSFSNKPEWVEMDSLQLILTPGAGENGMHFIEMLVRDTTGNTSVYKIRVKIGNTPPVFISDPVCSGTSGNYYTYQAIAEDADGDTIEIGLRDGPSWLTLTENGVLQGTPDTEQTMNYHVSLVAIDQFGGETIQEFDILVTSFVNNEGDVENLNNNYFVFPNPASDKIFIYLGNYSIKGSIKTDLVNLQGQKLLTKNFPGKVYDEVVSIDISQIVKGIYFLIIYYKNEVVAKKVIVN